MTLERGCFGNLLFVDDVILLLYIICMKVVSSDSNAKV